MAKKTKPLTVSLRGVRMVAGFEGFRSRPYRDAVGVWTIGYGETKNVGPRTRPWTRAYAALRLRVRLNEFGRGVQKHLKRRPTQNEYDALVSFAYNVGLRAFASSTLLKEFNRGHKKHTAAQFLRWDKAGGRRLLGLTRRRRAERSLFLK